MWNFLIPLLLLDGIQAFKPTIHTIAGPFNHAEEPHFDYENQILIFIDQDVGKLCIYDTNTRQTTCTCPLGEPLGAVLPIAGSCNEYLVGYGTMMATLWWDGCQGSRPKITILGRYDEDTPGCQFNDGKADCAGRPFMDTKAGQLPDKTFIRGQARFYLYSTKTCSLKDLDCSGTIFNGIAWNCNSTKMYLAETQDKLVYSFDYDLSSGDISNKKVAFDFTEKNIAGSPDGMTIDRNDNLWIACLGGYQVIQVNPERGQLLNSIKFPVRDVLSLTWGGCDLCTLFVTTSQEGLTKQELKEQPLAGYVFAVDGLGAQGLPANNAVICTGGVDFGKCADQGSCSGCGGTGNGNKIGYAHGNNSLASYPTTGGKSCCQNRNLGVGECGWCWSHRGGGSRSSGYYGTGDCGWDRIYELGSCGSCANKGGGLTTKY